MFLEAYLCADAWKGDSVLWDSIRWEALGRAECSGGPGLRFPGGSKRRYRGRGPSSEHSAVSVAQTQCHVNTGLIRKFPVNLKKKS